MKKITAVIMAVIILISFTSCTASYIKRGGVVKVDSWPLDDYPEPEGAEAVSCEKNYNGITVVVMWDSMESAVKYTKVLEKICGTADQADPKIEKSEKSYTYSSYKFTVSYSEEKEQLNYIHIY